MKIIIISQVFWPDESAGSLMLTDLAESLTKQGFAVDVITSGHSYESSDIFYFKDEKCKSIHIKGFKIRQEKGFQGLI